MAVAAGEGLKAVFGDLGVDAVVSGGQTMNPSTEDILAAVQSVPAKTVLVLPNNKNIIMAAEQAQKLADRKVIVLPTRTVPQGMTAMLNFDPDLKPEENAVAMMQAADHVSTGLITYAARDSEFDGKPIKKGEIMALENGKIVATGTDLVKMTYRLARSMKKKDAVHHGHFRLRRQRRGRRKDDRSGAPSAAAVSRSATSAAASRYITT